jgi:hypothetical protein
MMLLAPRRSLLVEIPAIAVTSHRKLRDLEQAPLNGPTHNHHSAQSCIRPLSSDISDSLIKLSDIV